MAGGTPRRRPRLRLLSLPSTAERSASSVNTRVDNDESPKAGGRAIYAFTDGALTFLNGGHASAGILVDGMKALLEDEVPIGFDHPNGPALVPKSTSNSSAMCTLKREFK